MNLGIDLRPWAELLTAVGASPLEYVRPSINDRSAPRWLVQLRHRGIEVDIGEVELSTSGVYTYQGQHVLVYIKDTQTQEETLIHTPEESRRFHFTECKTIKDMKGRNRYARYVAIRRTDGLFPVFSREIDGSHRELEAGLKVCKYCLKEIAYKGYGRPGGRRGEIWRSFNIEEFFEEYDSSIPQVPEPQESRGAESYTHNWQALSRSIREEANWKCSECNVDLTSNKALLQVHHRNGVRTDNRQVNLVPLCVVCHSFEPLHRNMYVSSRDLVTVNRLRLDQGL